MSYGNPLNAVLRGEKSGKQYETDVIGIMKTVFKDNKKYEIIDCTGTPDDYNEGTDLIVGKIRLDPTLNFDGKNFMPYIVETNIKACRLCNFSIGIRHGNEHVINEKQRRRYVYHEFKQPVVVIGVTMSASEYRIWEDDMESNLRKNAEALVEAARECLFDYVTTAHTDKRENYKFKNKLHKNPNYHEPKSLGTKYKKANTIRDELGNELYNTNIQQQQIER